jgi:hypothetical protein
VKGTGMLGERQQRDILLREIDAALYMLPPAQLRKDPSARAAVRFARGLRHQGFLPSIHFAVRYLGRALTEGRRFDPRTFSADFSHAHHYRQTRPGYNTLVADMGGLPVLYRYGGPRGKQIVLVGLLPEGGLPPVTPISAPRRREAEYMIWPFGRKKRPPAAPPSGGPYRPRFPRVERAVQDLLDLRAHVQHTASRLQTAMQVCQPEIDAAKMMGMDWRTRNTPAIRACVQAEADHLQAQRDCQAAERHLRQLRQQYGSHLDANLRQRVNAALKGKC